MPKKEKKEKKLSAKAEAEAKKAAEAAAEVSERPFFVRTGPEAAKYRLNIG